MADPVTIVQLTDPHIGAPWSGDPGAALAAAVAAVARVLQRTPDAVIVTGDIASTPSDEEYAEARALLDGLDAPLYVMPGNHDDRDGLRRHFDVPGPDAGGPVNYTAAIGPVRLVVLDTMEEGTAAGRLDEARLAWLDRALAQDAAAPTLLAMHHPPLVTGIPGMDAIGIAEAERRELAAILARHGNVHTIACGHVHRTIAAALAGASVLAIPSTDAQLRLDLATDELAFVRETPCFGVHVLVDGRLVSHVQPVS